MRTGNDVTLNDTRAKSSIEIALRDFGKYNGPAAVLFDNDSQIAFLRTYNSAEVRSADLRLEPFIVLCEKGLHFAAS